DRPGIVHRLDKGTSGLLVVARSPAGFRSLSAQLREHRAEREYLALAVGAVASERGVVDAPIGRSSRHPDRMTVSTKGRPARTAYTVRARYREPLALTLLEVALETGRTHQVRVHLTAIGHPVVGDDRYGAGRARPAALAPLIASERLFLHAWRLTVDHPTGGDRRTWESELPADLAAVLDALP
ncbi:MAG TPA: pseudouridine synthase, partial [Acidimicrobiales bacterium]|nr:pseudouridine synthase [Acidimicrobiales bacterium]